MEMVVLQIVGLLLKLTALVCSSFCTGSAASRDGVLGHFYTRTKLIPTASAPMPQPNAPDMMAPHIYASEPQSSKGLPHSTWFSPLPTNVKELPPSSSVSPTSSLGQPQPQLLPGEAPEQSDYPIASPPSIRSKTTTWPISEGGNTGDNHSAPTTHSPAEAPNVGKRLWRFPPLVHFPLKRHHHKVYETAPAPMVQAVPPISGSSAFSQSPAAAPSVSPVSEHAKISFISPVMPPSKRPLQALPPPPSQRDCLPLICSEPLTYGPSETPCACVLPMQVGLRLSLAFYTFFPMVSELAAEIAMGTFLKRSQVRIMGANTSGDYPDKIIVLVDLLPVGEKIDDSTAYLIFKRFWSKKVDINSSLFGGYDVLYVRYPGLPPSPPSPPYTVGIIASKPYPGADNNARNMEPFGVDVLGRQHEHGLKGSAVAIIVISCSVALILSCAVAWIFLFRYRHKMFESDPTAVTTVHSMAKSSGIAVSIGSGPSSPSFSLGSSIAAYTGSARKFSSREIERATDFFNESRILGEGGFGRVYSGTLEDRTNVAIKILKRFDQQSGREFLAEVEMLSRLHHRNLVKLIGICVEDRIHCLIYELIPNGSVESHLHGTDKERSPLDWSARIKIALGAARALAYLHEDSSPRVIHRDFKASNILLEDDFSPKVSDFGLARTALDEENRHISTRVMGTFGYVAPEYAMTGHLLVQSDVYSYGVVLLELLTGRKPVDMSRSSGEENLVSWARPLLTSREGLETIIDQSLGPDFPFDSIAKVAAIASMCVQPEVSNRPFMGEVVQALKLVCSECERMMQESPSRYDDDDDDKPEAPPLLSPSSEYGYNYLLELERDLLRSELLTGSAQFDGDEEDGNEPLRRYSSSGPLTSAKTKAVWKTMRQFKRSMSEHGTPLKLWPSSH